MSLFQMGDFLLNSQQQSSFKIECDSLTHQDWETIASLIVERVGPFSTVEGVPRGGVYLAELLNSHSQSNGPLLIVDDVWTTGGSMERHRDGRDAIGAVVFARALPAPWVFSLFQLGAKAPWAL